MKTFLPNDIKDQNRKVIYDILLNNSSIAKTEVSKMIPMSSVTVGKIIDYFEKIGLLNQSDEIIENTGGLGRKKINYNFNPNKYVSIGVQIINGKISAVLLNLKYEVIDVYNYEGKCYFWENKLVDVFKLIKQHFTDKINSCNSNFLGIGIAVDGAINTSLKTLRLKISATEEKIFSYGELIDILEAELELPVLLENDVNASVLSEFNNLESTEEKEVNNLLEIALDSGIGAGIILNKKLYRGNNTGVGELEFMCFDLNYISQPTSVGWLETKLNANFLEEKFNIDFKNIEDADSIDVNNCIEYVSKHIALTICNTVSLLDISNIVLSGPVINALSTELIDEVETYVARYTGWKLNIFVGRLERSNAIGAAQLSIENEITKILFD